MDRLHVRALGFCLVAIGASAHVSAQSFPPVEVSGGYQFVTFSVDDQNESMPKGWYFDVVGNINPMLGVVFQVGGNYKTFEESFTFAGITAAASADVKVHEFLGGIRLNARSNSAVVPFAQVLLGGINAAVEVSATTTIPGVAPIAFTEEESGTDLGLEVGGGVNFGLGEALGLRVGVDYLRVFADDGANVFRFHAGIVIGR